MMRGNAQSLPHRFRQAAQASLVLLFLAFPMSVALANVAMLLTLVFWALSLTGAEPRGDLKRAMLNPLAIPALALFAWVVMAIAWSPAPMGHVTGFIQKYLKFAMVPLFIALLQDSAVRRRCWQGFAVAMLFTLVVTWLNVWFDFSWTRTHNTGFGRDHTVFKDYIAQGLMTTVFAGLCVYLALRIHRPWLRALMWLVWALASASVLLLLQGRTGYLAWAASTVVFALVIAAARSRRMVIITLVTLMAMFTAVVFSSSVLRERLTSAVVQAQDTGGGPVTSIGARIEMAEFTWQGALQAPLLGHGTASYPVLAPMHFTDAERCSVVCAHPHNQFLFFMFEQGAIGLVLFLWFLGAIVREGWRHGAVARGFALSFVATASVASLSHSSFWLSTESHCLILMSALIMSGLRARRPPGAST